MRVGQEDVSSLLEIYLDVFSRCRRFYSIAPAVATAMTPRSLARISVPLRVAIGADDEMAPREPNANHPIRHVPRASLLTLESVDHYTFLPTCGWAGRWVLGEVCHERTEPRRADVHRRVAGDALEFFSAHLE